jgi:hypothetical protein
MRLLFVLISINTFGQPLTNEVISNGQKNANQFLVETVGKRNYEAHVIIDSTKNSVTAFKDGEFQRLPLKTAEKILTINYSYYVVDKKQTLYSFEVKTTNEGTVKDSKKGMRNLEPYFDLANGLVEIDLNKMKVIVKEKGMLVDNCSWTLDRVKRKLIWTITEDRRPNKRRVIELNSKTGEVMDDYVHVVFN